MPRSGPGSKGHGCPSIRNEPRLGDEQACTIHDEIVVAGSRVDRPRDDALELGNARTPGDDPEQGSVRCLDRRREHRGADAQAQAGGSGGRRLDGLHHFDGSLDEVRIYERALTAAEISSIRTSNATGIPNVVLDLPLG